jgi:hypothetical protein
MSDTFYAKVIKSNSPAYWYSNRVGQTFVVRPTYDSTPITRYTRVEDDCEGESYFDADDIEESPDQSERVPDGDLIDALRGMAYEASRMEKKITRLLSEFSDRPHQ